MNKLTTLCCVLFVVCFCARWISIEASTTAFTTDPDAYRLLATEWKATGIYGTNSKPTAFRPPLYPWFLSFGVSDDGTLSKKFILAFHSVLGATTCLITFLLAKAIQDYRHPIRNTLVETSLDSDSSQSIHSGRLNKYLGPVLAASLVALDPILLRQSQLIMTETLATCLATATLYVMLIACQALSPLRSSLVGLAIGLSILCRPAALVWGVLFIWALAATQLLLLPCNLQARRSLVLSLLCCMTGILVTVLPWGIRNKIEFNRFLVTTTHGGYTLLLANNHSLYDHFEKTTSRDWDDSDFQDSWASAIRGVGEWEQDRMANAMAWEVIESRPVTFLKSCMIRLAWLWAPWPNQSSPLIRYAIGVWYSFTFVAAIAGFSLILTRISRPYLHPFLVPATCLILSLSLVHSIYWSNLRMRSVAMPALYVLATAPLSFVRKGKESLP